MGWRDLLVESEHWTLPWLGGRSLQSKSRTFKIKGPLPRLHGWYVFVSDKGGNKVTLTKQEAEPDAEELSDIVIGYLVGDHVVPDGARCDPDPQKIIDYSEKVHCLSEGMDRFTRIRAGRVFPEGPLIYIEQTYPFGPEDDVMNAFMDGKSISQIQDVTPALEASYRMEVYQKEQAEKVRAELEKQRREEEERIAKEERRKALVEKLGDGEGRRALAKVDFLEAARAALAVGGAELLDTRKNGRHANERVVKYRVDGQRLECVCNLNLQIIDAGVCLVDHDTDERGDTYFTLESLPGVIRQAIRENKLVIWRH
jgi:hypothetical protein